MAFPTPYEGSASITGTEYSCPNASTTLTPITDQGTVQVFLDLGDMVAGDQLEIKIKEKVRSGGTQRTIYSAILTGTMADNWVSPALVLMYGWDVTLKTLAGTSITVEWSIRPPV